MTPTTTKTTSTCEPLFRTPSPTKKRGDPCYVKGAWYDQAAVDRVVRSMGRLRHSKGRWAGVPFDPEPWQIEHIIGPVFGWKHPDGRRIVREAWVELPRKNGKSTLAAALAIILLVADRELGAEVYSAATSKDQARIVFSEAKRMIERTKKLRGKVRPLADVVTVPATQSLYRVLSKMADAQHGLNVSGYTIDEIHVHKTRDLIDVITTGTGAREQPLGFFLTTADDGDDTTIYAEKHLDVIEQAEHAAAGEVEYDPTSYGVIFAAADEADPFALETWQAANPNLGVSVSLEYIEKEARRAKRTPSYLPTFCRLHLNQRSRSKPRWLPLDRWRAAGGMLGDLAGRRCFGGLDLASTDDFAAWILLFPTTVTWRDDDPGELAGYELLARFWVPEAAIVRREKFTATLRKWQRAGWLTVTPGDTIDFDRIEADIAKDSERFEIEEFSYDPWQAEQLRQHLMDGGLDGWKCSQRMGSLAAPSMELERLVAKRGIVHGGNPVLTWMVNNAIAKTDGDGNVKPDKAASSEKIDGVSALVMALAAATRPRKEAPPAPKVATGTETANPLRPDGRLNI